MARRSTKHANRLLDAMFRAAVEKDHDKFNSLDHDLLREYSDRNNPDEALDAMPRPILVRWMNAVRLLGPYKAKE